jgi:hypothetical protein
MVATLVIIALAWSRADRPKPRREETTPFEVRTVTILLVRHVQ